MWVARIQQDIRSGTGFLLVDLAGFFFVKNASQRLV
jgi:hypothetical protein